jgi:hypothetical protein
VHTVGIAFVVYAMRVGQAQVPDAAGRLAAACFARLALIVRQIFDLEKWTTAVTGFDRPIGLPIMAAYATNNSICSFDRHTANVLAAERTPPATVLDDQALIAAIPDRTPTAWR